MRGDKHVLEPLYAIIEKARPRSRASLMELSGHSGGNVIVYNSAKDKRPHDVVEDEFGIVLEIEWHVVLIVDFETSRPDTASSGNRP